jgi:hypothetical protein
MDNRREYSSGQDGVHYRAGMETGSVEGIDKLNSEKIGRWLMNLGSTGPLNPGNESYPMSGRKGWDQMQHDARGVSKMGTHVDGRSEMQTMYGSRELSRLPQIQQDARGIESPGFHDPNVVAASSTWDRPFPHDPLRNTTREAGNQREAPVFPGFSPEFPSYMRGGYSPYGTPPSISPGALYNQSFPVPGFNSWRATDHIHGTLPPRQHGASQPRSDLPPTSSFQTARYVSSLLFPERIRLWKNSRYFFFVANNILFLLIETQSCMPTRFYSRRKFSGKDLA